MATKDEAAPPVQNESPQDREAGQLSLLKNRPLMGLGAGHCSVDLCATVLPVFYPLLITTLGLSYVAIGALVTVQSVFGSISQPFFGWLSDRFGSRLLAPMSVLLAAGALAMVGFVPSYEALLVVVALLGLGVGAYHPQGAKGATILGGRWRTTALSIYMVCGTIGLSLAPLLGATLLVPAGLRSTTVVLLPALLAAGFLVTTVGRVDRVVASQSRVRSTGSGPIPWKGILVLGAVIVIRAWVEAGMTAFIPLFFVHKGAPREWGGEILSLLMLAMACGTMAGGWLADRVGRKPTLVVAFLLLAPAVHLFLAADGGLAFPMAVVVGLLMGCPVTVTLAAAQEVLPSHMGMASGIAISLTMIMGGLGVSAQGLIADHYGLALSMETMAIAPILAATASMALSIRQPR